MTFSSKKLVRTKMRNPSRPNRSTVLSNEKLKDKGKERAPETREGKPDPGLDGEGEHQPAFSTDSEDVEACYVVDMEAGESLDSEEEAPLADHSSKNTFLYDYLSNYGAHQAELLVSPQRRKHTLPDLVTYSRRVGVSSENLVIDLKKVNSAQGTTKRKGVMRTVSRTTKSRGNTKKIKAGGRSLNLSYITSNLIVFAVPNRTSRRKSLAQFLIKHHSGHCLLLPLDAEFPDALGSEEHEGLTIDRTYMTEEAKVPPLPLIGSCCRRMSSFISVHESNVVALCCKTGCDLSGLMAASFLLYQGSLAEQQTTTAAQAIAYFESKRCPSGGGIGRPSHRRYVEYYEKLLLQGKGRTPESEGDDSIRLKFARLTFGLPLLRKESPWSNSTFLPYMVVWCGGKRLFRSRTPRPGRGGYLFFDLEDVSVAGDVMFTLRNNDTEEKSEAVILRFCINTRMLEKGSLVLAKRQLDEVSTSRWFSEELQMELQYSREGSDSEGSVWNHRVHMNGPEDVDKIIGLLQITSSDASNTLSDTIDSRVPSENGNEAVFEIGRVPILTVSASEDSPKEEEEEEETAKFVPRRKKSRLKRVISVVSFKDKKKANTVDVSQLVWGNSLSRAPELKRRKQESEAPSNTNAKAQANKRMMRRSRSFSAFDLMKEAKKRGTITRDSPAFLSESKDKVTPLTSGLSLPAEGSSQSPSPHSQLGSARAIPTSGKQGQKDGNTSEKEEKADVKKKDQEEATLTTSDDPADLEAIKTSSVGSVASELPLKLEQHEREEELKGKPDDEELPAAVPVLEAEPQQAKPKKTKKKARKSKEKSKEKRGSSRVKKRKKKKNSATSAIVRNRDSLVSRQAADQGDISSLTSKQKKKKKGKDKKSRSSTPRKASGTPRKKKKSGKQNKNGKTKKKSARKTGSKSKVRATKELNNSIKSPKTKSLPDTLAREENTKERKWSPRKRLPKDLSVIISRRVGQRKKSNAHSAATYTNGPPIQSQSAPIHTHATLLDEHEKDEPTAAGVQEKKSPQKPRKRRNYGRRSHSWISRDKKGGQKKNTENKGDEAAAVLGFSGTVHTKKRKNVT